MYGHGSCLEYFGHLLSFAAGGSYYSDFLCHIET